MLVNGTSSGFFHISSGLRQGDPLSLFLFVLAIEAFGCLLKRAKEGGYVSSFRVTFIEDHRCGKDNIFPNEGGLHRLEVLRRASQSITCLCL